MRKMENKFHLEGYLYQHSLEKKVTGPKSANPGTEYITGEIEIATDDAITNIIPVHYTYVTSKTKAGGENATFTTLNNIINGTIGSVMGHGIDKAGKLRIDTSLALNEFYSDRTGKMELVSAPRNEGGFVHVVQVLEEDPNQEKRNLFDCDILITNVRHIDENEAQNIPERTQVSGYIFNFKQALMPFTFIATAPGAMDYYESLVVNEENPILSRIKGRQICTTVTREIVEESAFGTPSVRYESKSRREYLITWGQVEPYDFGDESVMTKADVTAGMAERETMLADLRSRKEQANAVKANGAVAAAAPASANAGFNF